MDGRDYQGNLRPLRGRLIDRDAGFGQSLGTFKIQRGIARRVRNAFYLNDWFHTLVNTRTHRIVGVVCFTYIILYIVFAILYLLASSEDSCFPELYVPTLGKNGTVVPTTSWRRFARATFFSIETMMTIGYGVDQWKTISDCPQLLLLIALQSLVGVFTSSVLFGIVLMRVSRADQRARTVAFSAKAVVRLAYNRTSGMLHHAQTCLDIERLPRFPSATSTASRRFAAHIVLPPPRQRPSHSMRSSHDCRFAAHPASTRCIL